MTRFLVCVVGGILVCGAWSLRAQEAGSSQDVVKAEVVTDVHHAATIAKVKLDDKTVRLLAAGGRASQVNMDDVYATVPAETRVTRLADYLSAKARTKEAGAGSAIITGQDVRDFNWGYIKSDTRYSPVRLASPGPAQLREVAGAHGAKYRFDPARAAFEPGSVILIPMMQGAVAAPVTVELKVGNNQVFWTGAPEVGMMNVVLADTSRGCMVDVASSPPEAKIYFNGVEWYRPTNTSVIRPPGKVEVTLKLAGYKPWSQTRDLSAGGSWVIKVKLVNE